MATIEKVATYEAPGRSGSPVELKSRYDNFIGGHWIAPINGEYAENVSPATGEPFTEVPRSSAILFRTLERSVVDVSAQASLAA